MTTIRDVALDLGTASVFLMAKGLAVREPISIRLVIERFLRAAQAPRPFYIIGHRANTIDEAKSALERGANAIECDIQVTPGGHLCVNHDAPSEASANPLVPYLQQVKQLLDIHPQLAMVLFDSKIQDPALAKQLFHAAREHLTSDTDLSIIVSVSTFAMRHFFDYIHDELVPREGLMIDEDNDPEKIQDFFESIAVRNSCYGNGVFVAAPGPNVRPSMEHATTLKANTGKIKWVCSWTLGAQSSMREYIRIGVDGIIVNDVEALVEVVNEPEFANEIRLAESIDNPFVFAQPAYGLTVVTDMRDKAGTDANLTFVLNGDKGSVIKTVDAWPRKRYEAGNINFVAMLGIDVGVPQSITVSRDDSGNAPDWFLDTITVVNRHDPGTYLATFNQWIPVYQQVTRTF
jgi:glycerophosphoryl diester phosphodiesterase